MRKADNPFEPGAGTRPPELVGRNIVLEDAEATIAKGGAGKTIRGQVFYGLRGVGKTVLLRLVSEMASNKGGIAVDLEVPENKRIVEILAPAMRKVVLELSPIEKAKAVTKNAARAVQAIAAKFKVKIGEFDVEVKDPGGIADSGDLEADLSDLLVAVGEMAKDQKKFVVIALDEMQYLTQSDLAALVTAVHRVNQKALPIGLFGAGLPQILQLAGNAKSYSERLFQFVDIGALAEPEAAKAIRDPIKAAGADIEEKAIEWIFTRSQGYPYFLQEWGYRTWNTAKKSPITEADAKAAEPTVMESLDKSFFKVRFDRLTESEKEYLRAMAELGPGPHRSGDVARVLGKRSDQLGPVRAKVIAKGMAYGGQYGTIHFSVPLFDDFMRREMPDAFEPRPTKRKAKTTR